MAGPNWIGLNGMTRTRRMAMSSTYVITESSLKKQRNAFSTISPSCSMSGGLMMSSCSTGIQIEEDGCGWCFRTKEMV